jgi:fatty-acyl-CoA synthase
MTDRPTSLYDSGTFGQLILSAIARFGDQPAIADDRQVWTYAELGDAVARAMAAFRSLGLGKGDGVAMAVGNRVEQVACLYAAMLLGMRYTALHLQASADTHAVILEDSEAAALIFDPAVLGERAADYQARAPGVRRLLSLGPSPVGLDLLALMTAAEPAVLRDEADSAGVAHLMYTGGTTGMPKGVQLPHRTLVTAALHQASDWDLPEGQMRFLAATPVTHASGWIIPTVLMRGGYVRLASGFQPESFCRLVAAEKINLVFLVPTMIYVLLDHPAAAGHDLSSLQTIVYGAAPMSPDRLAEAITAFGPVFVQLFGQTEAPMCITTLRKADHDPARPDRFGSAGLPCPAVQVRLFDSGMREVAVGEPGEICVRGPLVMDGYWKRPEETLAAFEGGWLHTGDVAVRSAEGFLRIVDRTKDLIISGGFNVYPREVEDALLAHPGVSSAAVIGVPDDKWGEAVTAFVVRRSGAEVDAATLKQHVRDARGPIWAPKSVTFVDAIPTTALGKVDRRALRELIA